MKPARTIFCATSLMVLGLASGYAQDTREQAVAGMRHVDAKEIDLSLIHI